MKTIAIAAVLCLFCGEAMAQWGATGGSFYYNPRTNYYRAWPTYGGDYGGGYGYGGGNTWYGNSYRQGNMTHHSWHDSRGRYRYGNTIHWNNGSTQTFLFGD